VLALADPISMAPSAALRSRSALPAARRRAWGLRTAIDGPLCTRTGDLLQPIVDGFAEGAGTADLQAARRVLAGLR
jgi:hypothetical protein